jgi:hypothetical protein
MSAPYRLVRSQIIGPLGTVVADVHGMATEGGRRDAATMLAALNAGAQRAELLRGLRVEAAALADAGESDGLRRLARVVAELIEAGGVSADVPDNPAPPPA